MNTDVDVGVVPSPSPPTMVVAAINDIVTIPTNPSMALTSVVATTTLKPDQHGYNSTGYLVEQDQIEYSILAAFSDMQTVFLACISTLLPLIIALAIAFGVRHGWRKYKCRRNEIRNSLWHGGVSSRDDTTESLHHCPNSTSVNIQPAMRILSAQDLVNGLSVPTSIPESEIMEEVTVVTSNGEFTSPGNHISKNANGNIITLTLKNNHLIVETEERMVSMEDNSFVVEEQPKCIKDNGNVVTRSMDNVSSRATDQQALVHREENPGNCPGLGATNLFGSVNTGLSQSDLSISSQSSVNRCYRYGNQMEYDASQLGYSLYACNNYYSDPHSCKLENDVKWVEFDKSPDVEKISLNHSENMNFDTNTNDDKTLNTVQCSLDCSFSLEAQDLKCANNSSGTLESNSNLPASEATLNKIEETVPKCLNNEYDKLNCNKPVITGALLKDETREQQNTQRFTQLNTFRDQSINLDSTCSSLETENSKPQNETSESSEIVSSQQKKNNIPSQLIEDNLDNEQNKNIGIYNQIKTSILPNLSPKFELFQNEVCPIGGKKS